MKVIGIIFTTVLLTVFSMISNGYALSVLWGWFVVPTFGLSPLTIPLAIGMAMVGGYLTDNMDIKKFEDKEWSEILFVGVMLAVFRPLAALAFGWVVLQFV